MGWNSFTTFFVNLPGGIIVDMVGKTGFILGLSMALIGIPYFFLGFSASYMVAMIVITFVGIGGNLWHPAALSFLARRYPERKGLAIAIHAMGANLGDTLAPISIGVVLSFLTWRNVLILNAIPGILMGFVLWKILVKAGTVEAEAKGNELSLKEYWAAVKAMAVNKSILLLCCLSGIRYMTQFGLFTFLPIYLAYELKYSPALVGTYITIVQAAGIFGSPISGVVSDKKGRRPVLTAGLITTSLLLVALVILRLNFLFIGVLAFLGFFLFSLRPVMFAWTMDLAPKNVSGTVVSALFGIQSLFSSFAPAICGFVADRFGILYSFYFLAATIFAANFLVYLIPDKPLKEEVAVVPQA
jgi:MFS family permease